MGRETKLRGTVIPGGFAQNAKFFPSDIISGGRFDAGSTELIIIIKVQTGVILEATLDGTTFGALNSGIPLIPNTILQFGLRLKHDAKFNLRTPASAGVTVDICEIHEDRR